MPPDQPTLRHPRVTLRPFTDADVPLVIEAGADPHIPLITTVVTGGDRDDALAFIARQNDRPRRGLGYSFAVTDTATGEAVGQIGLWTSEIATGRASTGYWVVARHRGHGYARAALEAVTEWAWTFPGIHRLQLFVEPWNEASWRTAESCGFEREGLLRSWQQIGQERRDLYVYARLRPDAVTTTTGRPDLNPADGR